MKKKKAEGFLKELVGAFKKGYGVKAVKRKSAKPKSVKPRKAAKKSAAKR